MKQCPLVLLALVYGHPRRFVVTLAVVDVNTSTADAAAQRVHVRHSGNVSVVGNALNDHVTDTHGRDRHVTVAGEETRQLGDFGSTLALHALGVSEPLTDFEYASHNSHSHFRRDRSPGS